MKKREEEEAEESVGCSPCPVDYPRQVRADRKALCLQNQSGVKRIVTGVS